MFLNNSLLGILRHSRTHNLVYSRPIKNFGHKREPVPIVTTIWHGFLTFSFVGMVLNWEKIKEFMFGDISEAVQESIQSNDK